jgi:hypothetical protein
MPPAACEPICTNQVARMTLLMAMPMLDDVDITMVQRGNLSHGVAIPGTDVSGGLGGTTGGRGGVVIGGRGGGLADSGPTGSQGSSAAGGSGPAPVEVVLRHFHWYCYRSIPLWFFCWRGFWSLGC